MTAAYEMANEDKAKVLGIPLKSRLLEVAKKSLLVEARVPYGFVFSPAVVCSCDKPTSHVDHWEKKHQVPKEQATMSAYIKGYIPQ